MAGRDKKNSKRRKPVSAGELGKLFDRMPPQALEAEMSLLGSMILDHTTTGDVLQHIRSSDSFYSQQHGAIFDALVETYDVHHSGDLVQLLDALQNKGVLDDIGGGDYLVQLAESVPTAVNAPHYARIVSEKHKLRRLIDAAGQIVYDAYHAGELGPEGAKETLDNAEKMIFDIAEEATGAEAATLQELLHQAIDSLIENDGKILSGLDTGYHKLNELTGGLQAGELIIVAARPSMGKTALALNLAEQIATIGHPNGGPAPVAVFSLEMSKQAVAQRLICATSGVDSHRLRRNTLNKDEHHRLQTACGDLSEVPLYIDDSPGLSVLQLRARARRMARQHDIKCIIVDYLQLLTAPGSARESRQVEVSAISRGIKALARELNIPVVCLSQLNRGAEQREGHRPRMSDLRESGSIEQDADVIALLHREEYYHTSNPSWADENPDKVGLAELILAKQRNGPTGVVEMIWDSSTTRFKNYAGRVYTSSTMEPSSGATSDAGSGFSSRERTGPVDGHRDGGGPDQNWKNADISDVPF
ncbi:MAG: replicative DNA helicase [Planctomycetota bacterium]|jgi:replicative DNA helicase